MKKVILLFIGVLSMSLTYGQDITDALRYSQDDIQGTARFRALSGAFGALGGDMGAVSINPAGSSIFNLSHISLSLSNGNNKNETQYYNGFNSSTNSNVDLNQVGAAFVFKNRNGNSNWRKFTLAVAYDKVQDFDDDWFASGTNTNANPDLSNSIASYFLDYANGLRLDQISAFDGESYSDAYADIGSAFGFGNQQAFLGYESYILEPEADDDANTVYDSNIAAGNFDHEYSYAATGYNGKFTVNASAQYGENILLGINLNTHFINYDRYTYLFEGNSNTGSLVNEVGFENNLSTIGSGFSLQLGGIFKIADQFRIGVTYNTPTWYTIEEETTQYIATNRNNGGSTITQIIDPQIINLFPEYKIQTPGKLTGSFAYIFGDHGLISFDYSTKNYANAKFRPTSDAYFSNQNNDISNALTTAATYRVGGEYRFNRLSFRGGYRFEESPYKNGTTVGDLTGYSIGLGYSFGRMKLDLTFDHAERESDYQFYSVGLTESTAINAKSSNITASLSFNL